MTTDALTLRQLIALRGYDTQKDLLDAVRAQGLSCPQPVLSAMVNGKLHRAYPGALAAVAAVLEIEVAQLETHIRNAAR